MRRVLKKLGIIFSIFFNVILGIIVAIFILRQEITYDVLNSVAISCKDKKIEFQRPNSAILTLRYPPQYWLEPIHIILQNKNGRAYDSTTANMFCNDTDYYIKHALTVTANRAGYIKAIQTDFVPK